MKKASIQLSTNFIVVMVLTLVVLGMGFTIFGKLFDGANKLVNAEIDERCKNYLDTILRNTDVAFCETTVSAKSGDSVIAWLGVVNTYDNNACYRIIIPNNGIESESGSGTLEISTLDTVIQSQDSEYIYVRVDTTNAERGTYAVTLQVQPLVETACEQDSTNDEGVNGSNTQSITRKLFVEVD